MFFSNESIGGRFFWEKRVSGYETEMSVFTEKSAKTRINRLPERPRNDTYNTGRI
jgi:hypothetical protein